MEEKKLYTPLQALNNIRYNFFEGIRSLDNVEPFWFAIVENSIKESESWERDYFELKDKYDQLEDIFNEIESEEVVVVSAEKSGAFEIIKEKRVDITTLLDCYDAKEYNRWNGVRSHYSYPPLEITQEEFDLLKEVLL